MGLVSLDQGPASRPSHAPHTVSGAIETHPARLDQARRLRDRMAPLDVFLAVDPDPTGPRRAMRSARLAFGAAAAEHTHHVVLQDDVWVHDGFADAVRQATELFPDAIVSLFVEWGLPTATLARWAAFTGATAVPVAETYVPTQGVVLPSEVSREVARYLRTEVPTDYPDDVALLEFARREGVRALVLVPNLLEHMEIPSLTGNGWQGERRSVCLLPEPAVGATDSVLSVPAMVPFTQWDGDVSMMIMPHPLGFSGWLPTLDVLADWGTSPADLGAACREQLSGRPGYAAVRSRVDDGYLFSLWLSAVAMGAIQAVRWPGTSAVLDERLRTPVGAQALRTMAPGALRLVADPDFLATHADDLDALVVHGLKFGAAACRPNLADIW